VFFTTIIFGALMPFFIKFFKKFDDDEIVNNYIELSSLNATELRFEYQHPNFLPEYIKILIYSQFDESKEKDINKLKQRLSYWLGTYWKEFDNFFLKPLVIYRWPLIKEEHDEIADIIKTEIESYNSTKKLKKEQETDIKEIQVLNIDTPERSKVGNLMNEDVPVLTLFATQTNPNTSKSKLVTP
jgi:hypothetical protein